MDDREYLRSLDELKKVVRSRPFAREEKVYFEASFPMIHQSLWGDLMSDLLRTVAGILGDDYITKWSKTSNWIGKYNTVRKTVSLQEAESLPAELLADASDGFLFESFAKSDTVVKRGDWEKEKRRRGRELLIGYNQESANYREAYLAITASGKDRDEMLSDICDLFYAPNMSYESQFSPRYDALGYYYAYPMSRRNDFFSAVFDFSLSISSLSVSIDQVTEALSQKAWDLCTKYTHMNSSILILPNPVLHGGCLSGYYNLSDIDTFVPPGETKVPWIRNFFLRDCGWFNTISPGTALLLDKNAIDLRDKSKTELYEKNGALGIKLTSNASAVDVKEYLNMKEVIYSALCPGRILYSNEKLFDVKSFNSSIKPRAVWERVPVFRDEIQLTEEGITVTTRNFGRELDESTLMLLEMMYSGKL